MKKKKRAVFSSHPTNPTIRGLDKILIPKTLANGQMHSTDLNSLPNISVGDGSEDRK